MIAKDQRSERVETFEIKFYAFESIDDLCKAITEHFRKAKVPVSFVFNTLLNKVTLTASIPWLVDLTDDMHIEFGLRSKRFQPDAENMTYTAPYKCPEKLNTISALYVYTDIQHQYVGDELAPLLRVVSVDNRPSYGEIINKIYTSPMYVPVSRSYIDTIQLDIRDDTGTPVQFGSGKLLIKLHFKPHNGL